MVEEILLDYFLKGFKKQFISSYLNYISLHPWFAYDLLRELQTSPEDSELKGVWINAV